MGLDASWGGVPGISVLGSRRPGQLSPTETDLSWLNQVMGRLKAAHCSTLPGIGSLLTAHPVSSDMRDKIGFGSKLGTFGVMPLVARGNGSEILLASMAGRGQRPATDHIFKELISAPFRCQGLLYMLQKVSNLFNYHYYLYFIDEETKDQRG